MTSSGDGVYKSVDAGETWEHIGLDGTKHISQVRIHPKNPDVMFVSAQGSPYADTQDREFTELLTVEKLGKVLFVDAVLELLTLLWTSQIQEFCTLHFGITRGSHGM